MQTCELELGPDPWTRLAEGPVQGVMRYGDGPELPITAKIRGAHSRKFPKRSLQVTFRRDRLPDGPPYGHTVHRLHLNAEYIDPTLMRSALSYAQFEAVGAPAPRWRHTALTVSGEFAGLYLALESVDADFLERRGLAPGPIYYGVSRTANFGLISPSTGQLKQPVEMGYQMVDRADPRPLRRFLTEINLVSDRGFPRVAQRFLDVDGYLRWLMVAVFVGNRDGFVHNYALYRSSETDRFSIIPWDYDATWGMDIHGRPARVNRVPVAGWNKLTDRLLAVPDYREQYREMFLSALAGPFVPAAIGGQIDKLCNDLTPWIDKDQQVPGGNRHFSAAVAILKGWPEVRGAVLAEELQHL